MWKVNIELKALWLWKFYRHLITQLFRCYYCCAMLHLLHTGQVHVCYMRKTLIQQFVNSALVRVFSFSLLSSPWVLHYSYCTFSIELLQLLRELELHISKLTKTKCSYETFIERWSTLSKCFQKEDENNGKLLKESLI